MPNIITGQGRRVAVNGLPQLLILTPLTQVHYRGHRRYVVRNGVTHDLKEHIDFVESKYIPSGPYRTVPVGELMVETIVAVNGVHDLKLDKYSGYDGFEVVTDKQRILLLIGNGQNCCERWGYLMSEDKFDAFIGAQLRDVTLTDTALKTYGVGEQDEYDRREQAMFVNLETDRGTLQFVAYNEHNGYYGHEVRVVSQQLNHEDYL